MGKHTPAPWELDEDGYIFVKETAGRDIEHVPMLSPFIESAFEGDDTRRDEALANMRIMAQSLALLEALEEQVLDRIWEDDANEEFLLFWCFECDCSGQDRHTRIAHANDCSVGRAAAAIAKARGEEATK